MYVSVKNIFLVGLQSNFGFWNDVVFLFDVNILVNLEFALKFWS